MPIRNISDAPISGQLPRYPDSIEYWKKAVLRDPSGTMRHILWMLAEIRNRKPFDLEYWTEWAEIGHEAVMRADPPLRDAFLRVTSHDKRRRLDARIVARSRIAIIRILQKEDSRRALHAVNRQLSQLPFKDTFVGEGRYPHRTLEWQQRELLKRYRLALEILQAELLTQTSKTPDVLLMERIQDGEKYFGEKDDRRGRWPSSLSGYHQFSFAESTVGHSADEQDPEPKEIRKSAPDVELPEPAQDDAVVIAQESSLNVAACTAAEQAQTEVDFFDLLADELGGEIPATLLRNFEALAAKISEPSHSEMTAFLRGKDVRNGHPAYCDIGHPELSAKYREGDPAAKDFVFRCARALLLGGDSFDEMCPLAKS